MIELFTFYHNPMSREELRFISSKADEVTSAAFRDQSFDFQTVDLELMRVVSALNQEPERNIDSITSDSLSLGFNTTITGGGIHRIRIGHSAEQSSPQSFILKSIPPFTEQQQAMFRALDQLGERDFIDILAAYPSNKLTQREILSYQLLSHRTEIRIPKFYLGILNQLTEQAWIFMEDLSQLTVVTADIYHWRAEIMIQVLKKMADFHALFWNNIDELDSAKWLGHWWTVRDNDFVAEDVTTYALDRCAQLQPEYLTSKRITILQKLLKNRQVTHASFSQQPQTLIHWDHGPHNLRLSESTTPVQSVLFDWELTSAGLPQWDIAQFILPILGAKDAEEIDTLIDTYLSFLPADIQDKLNVEEFKRFFDIVVMDHFFRVCGPIVFGGQEIDKNSHFFKEWVHCLEWIELRFS